MKNNYFGLKEIKKKGTTKKYFSKDVKKISYDEKKAKFLIIKYKKFNKVSAKNSLITMCYPIIFSVLKKVGRKINTSKMLFNHDDLFNEGVLIVDRCINAYKIKYRVKFSTFLWISLNRGFIRFIDTNLLRPQKIFVSIMEHSDEENSDTESLENIYNKKKYQKEVSDYLKNEEIDSVENDLLKNFTDLETRVIYLKYKKYDSDEITKILEISSSKYYKILKKVKNKTRRDF